MKKDLKNCTFLESDLRSLRLESNNYDGLWCSFTAAYFTDFEKVVASWLPYLKDTAWICVIDIDDLLGHEPLAPKWKKTIEEFYDEAFEKARYDFRVGRKLAPVLKQAGFVVSQSTLKDSELSFNGPAQSDVKQAWADRLSRMGGLKNFLGVEFEEFKIGFLESLQRHDHRSQCKVNCCVGERS